MSTSAVLNSRGSGISGARLAGPNSSILRPTCIELWCSGAECRVVPTSAWAAALLARGAFISICRTSRGYLANQ